MIAEKRLSLLEIISLVNLKNLSVDKLLELKRKIVTEIDNRLNTEDFSFIFNKEYKKLELYNLVQENNKIEKLNFILTINSILLGYDNDFNFYIGVLDKDSSFNLLKINFESNRVNYYEYNGIINLEKKMMLDQSIKKIDNLSKNIIKILETDRYTYFYDQIIDEDINALNYNDEVEKNIITVYFKFKKKINNFDYLVNLILNGSKQEAKVMKKVKYDYYIWPNKTNLEEWS